MLVSTMLDDRMRRDADGVDADDGTEGGGTSRGVTGRRMGAGVSILGGTSAASRTDGPGPKSATLGKVHDSLDPADLLTAALVLLPPAEVSRNRHPDLHAGEVGARARRRAARIRATLRQLQGADGPARGIGTVGGTGAPGAPCELHYELGRLSLRRRATLPTMDLVLLRVALAERAVRLLPPAMKATAEDRALTTALVEAFRRARRV